MSDVTLLVDFQSPDDESLPLTRCACGRTYPAWDAILGIYPEHADPMPCCGRRLYFQQATRVLEVGEDE